MPFVQSVPDGVSVNQIDATLRDLATCLASGSQTEFSVFERSVVSDQKM